MLIDEDRVAVGVQRDEAGRPGAALVRLGHELDVIVNKGGSGTSK